jgi:hypothetical protein
MSDFMQRPLFERLKVIADVTLHATIEGSPRSQQRDTVLEAIREIEQLRRWKEQIEENSPLLAEIRRLKREIEILEMPECDGCGSKVTEECPRSKSNCFRAFHGGSYEAIQ